MNNTNLSPIVENASLEIPTQTKLPSRFMASLYLPIGIVIILITSFIEIDTTADYLIGIAAEILLVLLTIVFLKLEKLPVRQTLRLKPTNWPNVFFGVLAVPGVWLIGIVLNVIVALILGYTTPVPPSYYPSKLVDYILFAFSAVIVAPICEEIVFRGYFQRAFEKRSPWYAILIGSIIFAMYHLRFQGLFALFPIAIVMSFFTWRSDSIYVSMLMHATFNSIATFFMILNQNVPLLVLGVIILILVLASLVLLPGLVIGIWWVYKHNTTIKTEPAPAFTMKRTWKQYVWLVPFMLFLVTYVFFGYSEYTYVSNPEQRAAETITFNAYTSMPEDVELEYEVTNLFSKAIGQIKCIRRSSEDSYSVTCAGDVEASESFDEFEFDFLDSTPTLSSIPQTWEQISSWSSDLDLLSTNLQWESDGLVSSLTVDADGTFSASDKHTSVIVENTDVITQQLAIGEFAWRLQRLPLELGQSFWTHVIIRDNDDGTYSRYKALVTVDGGEPVWTPLDQFTAWKVSIQYTDDNGDDQFLAVWYDADNPDYPVKFNNGDAEYVLKSVSPFN